ncbi:hypothetical protein Ocin01_05663 [Orchesella cincta]|uniref:Uncharacterized protein n=1 Tax=Orchesella cincta TaxID=48709 RepID=A0A1D2N701_ORCCI|nr:hypothetical protein Ocin01_05663 [Orchesella cincta]
MGEVLIRKEEWTSDLTASPQIWGCLVQFQPHLTRNVCMTSPGMSLLHQPSQVHQVFYRHSELSQVQVCLLLPRSAIANATPFSLMSDPCRVQPTLQQQHLQQYQFEFC